MFQLSERILAFAKLGEIMAQAAAENATETDEIAMLKAAVNAAKQHNGWFDLAQQKAALNAWANELKTEKLEAWTQKYPDFASPKTPKKVAVAMAGNIPLVGFHDFLSTLLFGHIFLGKLSKEDAKLMPAIAQILVKLEPRFEERIFWVEKIQNPDAVIATGSNNSARYFEAYFAKFPHIIRKNRTSVAVISGDETAEELQNLGNDIFTYYGLGCRNVSKIYVPENYDLDKIFGAIMPHSEVVQNHKYANNYDYYRAIYMLNKITFLENGFVIFKEDESMHTPVAVVHYEYYQNRELLDEQLQQQKDELQCVVGKGQIAFGQTQQPALWDYADGVDTVEFLSTL